jgi:hypothetical protein
MATRASVYDCVETLPTAPSGGGFNPASFPRRLTPEALTGLRRRRTGVGRAVRQPILRRPPPINGSDEESGEESDEYDDSDDDDDDDQIRCSELICCCVGPRCCVASCMLMLALMGYSAAITYGIVRQPTYEQYAEPMRVARRRWFSKTPMSADDGFMLFDRNADGVIDVHDIARVAKITTGENPPHEELQAYIARGDLNGDGVLDEAEYTAQLHKERAEGKGKGKGKGGGGGSTSDGGRGGATASRGDVERGSAAPLGSRTETSEHP